MKKILSGIILLFVIYFIWIFVTWLPTCERPEFQAGEWIMRRGGWLLYLIFPTGFFYFLRKYFGKKDARNFILLVGMSLSVFIGWMIYKISIFFSCLGEFCISPNLWF